MEFRDRLSIQGASSDKGKNISRKDKTIVCKVSISNKENTHVSQSIDRNDITGAAAFSLWNRACTNGPANGNPSNSGPTHGSTAHSYSYIHALSTYRDRRSNRHTRKPDLPR
jgi:hypothetical protein